MVMGHDVAPVRRRAGATTAGEIVLEAAQVSLPASDAADRLDSVSLTIRAGEVLGVAGVEGSGQRGLVSVLTGLVSPSAGTIRMHGSAAIRADVAALRRGGMAHLPADRFADGGARSLSLVDNAIAGLQRTALVAFGPLLSSARALRLTTGFIARYRVLARSPWQRLGDLSGGNAQKLIAAREFSSRPRFLVADQPTRGIDIEAAAFIRARILELAEAGAAVLLISADLDELLALSDRVVVLFGGRIVARFEAGAALTPERLGPFMLGLAAN
jgi:simple sugar transport system ATP-binding protein